jgi:transcriptional regulator with XRE-family HTH domain
VSVAFALVRCCVGKFVSDHLDTPSSADLTLGQRIRRLRTEMHMTQNQLADGDCTNGYISAIEKGRVKTPRPELLKRLAHRLGVSVAVLQGELGEGEFGTFAELSAKLEYDQVHAKMLAAGRDAARGRAELEEIQRRMGVRAPRSLAWFAAYAACQEGDTEVALPEAEAYLSEADAGTCGGTLALRSHLRPATRHREGGGRVSTGS